MLDRIKFRRIWRQKQNENAILLSNFPKRVFSMKRSVVHNDNRAHRQQRDQLEFEPILEESSGRRVLIALQSNVLFAPQSADDICALLPLSRSRAVNFQSSSRTCIKAVVLPVKSSFINKNEVSCHENSDQNKHRNNVKHHIYRVFFFVGKCLFFRVICSVFSL